MNDTETPGSEKVFKDLSMLLSILFLVLLMILIFFIQQSKNDKENDVDPNGDVVIELAWPDNSDSDIDLWVKESSCDEISYTRKTSNCGALLRDDLGMRHDLLPTNYELVVLRLPEEGKIVVNVHGYRMVDQSELVPASVRVRVLKRKPDCPEVIKKVNVKEGVESTLFVVTYKKDEKGLIECSIDSDPEYIPIRLKMPSLSLGQ